MKRKCKSCIAFDYCPKNVEAGSETCYVLVHCYEEGKKCEICDKKHEMPAGIRIIKAKNAELSSLKKELAIMEECDEQRHRVIDENLLLRDMLVEERAKFLAKTYLSYLDKMPKQAQKIMRKEAKKQIEKELKKE